MSDSQEGSASPMSMNMMSVDNADRSRQSSVSVDDPGLKVENNVRELISTLSTCVSEIAKEKQITNKKIEEYGGSLRKLLNEIESGITVQLDSMADCLKGGDVNCCRHITDHYISTMDDMDHALRMHLKEAILRRDEEDESIAGSGSTDSNTVDLDETFNDNADSSDVESDEDRLIEPNAPAPVYPMKRKFIGKSILKNSLGKDTCETVAQQDAVEDLEHMDQY